MTEINKETHEIINVVFDKIWSCFIKCLDEDISKEGLSDLQQKFIIMSIAVNLSANIISALIVSLEKHEEGFDKIKRELTIHAFTTSVIRLINQRKEE